MEKRFDQLSSMQESKDESNNCESNTDAGRLHYSEREAQGLVERLQKKETFEEALQELKTLLEEGQCNEENSEHFHALIKLCRDHFVKVEAELKISLEEAQKAQESLADKIQWNQLQLDVIAEVFKTLENENILSNFTQNQIEEIQEMRRDVKNEIKESREIREKYNSISVGGAQYENSAAVAISCNQYLDQNDGLKIAAISVFLSEKPEGVNIDGICSHLNVKNDQPTSEKEIETFLRRFPEIFKEISDKDIKEKKWTCISTTKEEIAEFQGKHNSCFN